MQCLLEKGGLFSLHVVTDRTLVALTELWVERKETTCNLEGKVVRIVEELEGRE